MNEDKRYIEIYGVTGPKLIMAITIRVYSIYEDVVTRLTSRINKPAKTINIGTI
jgi:hypothetical protein